MISMDKQYRTRDGKLLSHDDILKLLQHPRPVSIDLSKAKWPDFKWGEKGRIIKND